MLFSLVKALKVRKNTADAEIIHVGRRTLISTALFYYPLYIYIYIYACHILTVACKPSTRNLNQWICFSNICLT